MLSTTTINTAVFRVTWCKGAIIEFQSRTLLLHFLSNSVNISVWPASCRFSVRVEKYFVLIHSPDSVNKKQRKIGLDWATLHYTSQSATGCDCAHVHDGARGGVITRGRKNPILKNTFPINGCTWSGTIFRQVVLVMSTWLPGPKASKQKIASHCTH